MYKKTIKVSIFIILLFTNNFVFWSSNLSNEKQEQIQSVYNTFVNKVETKYSLIWQIDLLEELASTLNIAIDNNKIKKDKISIIQYFLEINETELINKKEQYEKLIQYKNETEFKNKYNNNSNKDFLDKIEAIKNFSKISYNIDDFFIENWVRYYYSIWEFKYFKDLSNLNDTNFKYNWIEKDSSLVFYKNWILSFSNDFKKIKLINNSIIYWIYNKYSVLEELKDDKVDLHNESDETIKQIKNKITELINNTNDNDEKIQIIYDYILDNFSYSSDTNLENPYISSAIEMYKSWEWICEAYTKLILYMLSFAWVDDVEVVRWYAIDSLNFPEIWHTWIKIWNKYYDPTFDDPIWSTKTKEYSEYYYFWLPKDLLYVNRYDVEDLPEELKTTNLETRKLLVEKNLYNLYDKYKNEDYNFYKKTKLKIENGILYDEKITISNFNNFLPLYTVNNYSFTQNWKTKFIKKLNYFNVNDDNLETLLEQINYELDWYYFFKWKLEDWSYEYRVGYNVEFN